MLIVGWVTSWPGRSKVQVTRCFGQNSPLKAELERRQTLFGQLMTEFVNFPYSVYAMYVCFKSPDKQIRHRYRISEIWRRRQKHVQDPCQMV